MTQYYKTWVKSACILVLIDPWLTLVLIMNSYLFFLNILKIFFKYFIYFSAGGHFSAEPQPREAFPERTGSRWRQSRSCRRQLVHDSRQTPLLGDHKSNSWRWSPPSIHHRRNKQQLLAISHKTIGQTKLASKSTARVAFRQLNTQNASENDYLLSGDFATVNIQDWLRFPYLLFRLLG